MVITDSQITPRRRLAIVLLVAGSAIVLAVLFVGRISSKMPDLAVYWTAAARARPAEPLYRAEDGHYQFKYLPAFAVLATPLSAVSLESAKAIWFVASVALLAALVALSLRFLPDERKPTWLLAGVTLFVMLKFYGHELVLGQMNAVFAVIVAAAVVAARKRHESAVGLLIALAIVVKPYAVIFLPWLLVGADRLDCRSHDCDGIGPGRCRHWSMVSTATSSSIATGGGPSRRRPRQTSPMPTTCRSRRCGRSGLGVERSPRP